MPPGLSLSCRPVYFSALQTEPFIVAVALKKAFCKGCEFTASFLLEAGNLEK